MANTRSARRGPLRINRFGKPYLEQNVDRTEKRKYDKTRRAESPAKCLYYGAKQRAKDKGLPFGILSEDDIRVPAKCPVLGIDLIPGVGRLTDHSPTLDRIVPDKGYVPGNVVVVSMRANRLKSNATIQELVALAKFYKNLQRKLKDKC